MSAAERHTAMPMPPHGRDRRRDPRLHPPALLTATIGLLKATVADLSKGGCRLRHAGAVRGNEVVVRLRFGPIALTLPATVRRTGVVELGPQAIYETRLQFRRLGEAQASTLRSMLTGLLELQERAWLRNAEGVPSPPEAELPGAGGRTFVRLVRTGQGWKIVNTASAEQPADGITVPASLSHYDLGQLRLCYATANEDLRRLLRACAVLACREASGRR